MASIIIGTAAMAFAAKSIARTQQEMAKIELMWTKGTTIQDLEKMHADGKDLPAMVLVKGVISADGPPVGSICSRVDSLAPLMGHIDQPKNFMLGLGQKVASGEILVKDIDANDLPKDVKDDYSIRAT